MTDYLIAEFVDNINEIVKQPIHLTQRIKYTCCDVSKDYIVFGASSGGLYVFHRHPCSFYKLIPSTEGSVVNLSISPDEKLIGFATSKGTVCLVKLKSKNVVTHNKYTEHHGNNITAMKWNEHSEELFVGDNTGKISVVVSTNFITKKMFPNPCWLLLELDSQVVQIDACCNILLVSTLSRSYVCDTNAERYRQIGQKLRDGEFGACFFGINDTVPDSIRQQSRMGSFKILSDNESVDIGKCKIFCARPGLRLWEVENNGTVIRTHQFKGALNGASDNVIPIKNIDCRLELTDRKKRAENQTYNFIKMYVFNRNFILTYKKDAIYILDPVNGRVILWIDKYSNIIDIKIVNTYLYVVTQTFKIYVLLFSNVENFILKSFFDKYYLFCADLCLNFEKQIMKLISSSTKLHILSTLGEKLLEKNEAELHEKILSIINAIKEQSEQKNTAKKMENGIFIIDNAHFVSNTISDVNFGASTSTENSNFDAMEPNKKSENIDNNRDILRIYEQYELNKAIGTYNSKVLTEILSAVTIDNLHNIFIKLEQHGISLQENETDIKKWCYEKCLWYIYKHRDYVLLISNSSLDENLGLYLKTAFISVNNAIENSCMCTYPNPNASLNEPKFFKIGCLLLDKLIKTNDYTDFCYQVPYMWGQVLKSQQNNNLNDLLPLIIQYNNEQIMELFLKKFTYDHWHEALKLFVVLKSGRCLKCEKKFVDDGGISWNIFARNMLKSIGAETTVELLLQFADGISSEALGIDFYQCAIFSSMAENFQSNSRNKSIDFMKKICEGEQKEDFVRLLEKSLQNPASNIIYNKPATNKVEENCSGCSMPLLFPVLSKENVICLECGHSFHTICNKHEKNICNICKN